MSMLDEIRDQLDKKLPYLIEPRSLTAIRGAIYAARQFVFNTAASQTVGRFIRDCPDVLANNLEFAIPPYDPCYIEVDIDSMYREVRGGAEYALRSHADYLAGFLFIGNRVYVLINERANPIPFIAIFGTYFKRLGPTPDTAMTEDGEVEANFHKQLLGSSYEKLTPAQRGEFSSSFGVFHCVSNMERVVDKVGAHLEGSMGEARTIAAVLLMLYNRKHVTLTDRPAERRMVRGKSRAYMAHTTVQLSLTDPIEIRRSFSTGEHSPKRRHEVRTHYAHRRVERRCEHEWVRNDYADNEQWECAKCHGLRFLRREHLRGDGSVGFVTKTYHVKP